MDECLEYKADWMPVSCALTPGFLSLFLILTVSVSAHGLQIDLIGPLFSPGLQNAAFLPSCPSPSGQGLIRFVVSPLMCTFSAYCTYVWSA